MLPNKYPQRIFWCLVATFWLKDFKIWAFLGSILKPKINIIFMKIVPLSEYQISRTFSLLTLLMSVILEKVYLVKMAPIFECFNQIVLQDIWKSIEDVRQSGCKNILNFTCLTMKFHTSLHRYLYIQFLKMNVITLVNKHYGNGMSLRG